MSRSFLFLTAIALGAVAAPGALPAQERAPTRAEASKARSRAERDRARTDAQTGPRIHISSSDLGIRVSLPEGLGRDIQAALHTGLHEGLNGLGAGLGAGIAGLAAGLASLDGIVITDDDADRRSDHDRDRDRRSPVRQEDLRIDTTISAGRNTNVELKLISGPITVTSWDRDEIRVRATSTEIPIYFDRSGGSVRAGVRDENRWTRKGSGSGKQTMEVMVPVGTRVSASSVSGTVSVRGVRGEVEASSVSGNVDASEIARRARLNSVSGSVVADRIDGDVRANTVSGRVTLSDVEGDVEAETVSGAIQLRGVRSSRVKTNSLSGRVTYDGTIERDGRYEFHSFSGTIDLLLPTSAAGSVGVQTFSGSIDSDFTMTLRPGASRSLASGRGSNRNMEFTIGEGGGARLSAQTFSGNINLRRGRPRSDDRE